MQYYHQLVTEKSFRFLQELKKDYRFVLIGGWAVFLHTHSLKSKDIDIIVDYDELVKLKDDYEVFKNDRLKKYEIKTGEFDIDIYLPHYSKLGVDIEWTKKRSAAREGFFVPELEVLFLLKLRAWKERRGSAKGRKDELDIFSLAALPEFDWKKFSNYVEEQELGEEKRLFADLLKKTGSVPELGINEQRMAKLRKYILGKFH